MTLAKHWKVGQSLGSEVFVTSSSAIVGASSENCVARQPLWPKTLGA